MSPSSRTTLVSSWLRMRESEKVGFHTAHREIIPKPLVRLQAPHNPMLVDQCNSDSRETICEGNELFDNEVAMDDTEDNQEQASIKLKIFTGSWNMAAKDPFATSRRNDAYIGDKEAAAKLEEFIPPGYDVYVVGTQEKVSRHLDKAILARLHTLEEHNGRKYEALLGRGITKRLKKQSNERANKNNITIMEDSAGYEQTTSLCVLEASSSTLSSPDGSIQSVVTHSIRKQTRVEGSIPRRDFLEVRGRGDGAFLSRKSTSLAIYCATDIGSLVEVLECGAHKFSVTSGSKGGVAVTLQLCGEQTITFVNCHLEANRPSLRRRQLRELSSRLAATLRQGNQGKDDKPQELHLCSDHVVWMGDFNYRIHTLDGESVIKLLALGRHMQLHDRYDSMKEDMQTMPSYYEPQKWPNFYPTYKKIPHRTAVRQDKENELWPLQVYRVRYREPFYKGGRVKARVPGWCDRILVSSRCSDLEVEQVEFTEDDHRMLRDQYRSVNDTLCESDHSPVYCTFVWTLRHKSNI